MPLPLPNNKMVRSHRALLYECACLLSASGSYSPTFSQDRRPFQETEKVEGAFQATFQITACAWCQL